MGIARASITSGRRRSTTEQPLTPAMSQYAPILVKCALTQKIFVAVFSIISPIVGTVFDKREMLLNMMDNIEFFLWRYYGANGRLYQTKNFIFCFYIVKVCWFMYLVNVVYAV